MTQENPPIGRPDGRARAYRGGARIARSRMEAEAPLDARALEEVRASDVLVVAGTYDRVGTVLDALDMPYTTISPGDLRHAAVRPDQLVVVNCPGNLARPEIGDLREFVAAGGSGLRRRGDLEAGSRSRSPSTFHDSAWAMSSEGRTPRASAMEWSAFDDGRFRPFSISER